MIGPYGVYYHGRTDNDIYYKGAWVLQTLRETLENDSVFFSFIKELTSKNELRNISTMEIINTCNRVSGKSWEVFFSQYLYHSSLPVVEYRVQQSGDKWQIHYRLRTDTPGLDLPVRFAMGNTLYKVTAGNQWQTLYVMNMDGEKISVDNSRVLVEVLQVF